MSDLDLEVNTFLVTGKHSQRKIAYCQNNPSASTQQQPGILWLNGFRSDMTSSKVSAVHNWAKKQDIRLTRFDYSGHGASEGEFAEGTISQWLEESIAVLEQRTEGPVMLVGSSMGGWMALLLTLHHLKSVGSAHQSRIRGLVLIAPALNMTTDLIWMKMDDDIRKIIEKEGVYYHQPEEKDLEPVPITEGLIKDGAWHQIEGKIELHCPVRILQGMEDKVVPWRHALKLMHILKDRDVIFDLIKDGDHRLSRQEDINRLISYCEELCG